MKVERMTKGSRWNEGRMPRARLAVRHAGGSDSGWAAVPVPDGTNISADPRMSSDSELQAYFDIAVACARDAGAVIRAAINRPKQLTEKSNSTDIVTETDQKCEEIVIARIRAAFPSHHFIAEESYSAGAAVGYDLRDDPTWFIDPVDGTTNFVHGFPFTCVSIGLQIKRESVLAVVYNPVLDELFTAQRGSGAFLSVGGSAPQRLAVSATRELQRAMVLTEFGYDRTLSGVAEMLQKIERLLVARVQAVRSMGSCALNMCYVAAGRLDFYYEGMPFFRT